METLSATIANHPGQTVFPKDQDKPDKPTPVSEDLTKWLLNISDNIENADRDKRLSLFRKMIKAHQYFDGNFYGYVDENCEWKTRPQQDNEKWYSDNQYYPLVRTAIMEMSRRNTQIVVSAEAKNNEVMSRVAQFAQERIDANRERLFKPLFKQTENAYLLLSGIGIRYTFFDRTGARKERIPRIVQKDGQSEEQALCANCSRPVHGDSCNHCGSTFVTMFSIPTEPGIVIGYDELVQGRNNHLSVNPVSVIFQMQASCIEESAYVKYKQLILRSVLEEKYPGIKLPSTGTESVELRYITNQKLSTPASDITDGGYTQSADRDSNDGNELEILELQQHWLDYPLYCNKIFDKDQQLHNGDTLKAGQKMGDKWSDGLYFAKVGTVIPDIWNESKNEKWDSAPYSLRAGSMYGHGTHISHARQEKLNDLEALEMANAWGNSVPREFVNPAIIEELSADPSQVTEVNNPDGDPIIGYAYAQAPALQLSPEVYALKDKAEGSMQNEIGAMSNASGGLADAQKWGDTATAISIKRDLAVGRFGPDLELMADQLDRKQAEKFLKNEQRYFTPEQWKRYKGDYGEETLKAFLNADLDQDLVCSVVPGSYMPKTEAQEVSKLMGFGQVAPQIAQLGNPELMAYALEKFGIPEYLGGWSADKVHVETLTSRMAALAATLVEENGDAPDSDLENPEILRAAQKINEYTAMPVDIFLDNHPAIIDALKDWRTTDAGRLASNVLVAAVAFRMLKHQEAIVKQQQMAGRSDMLAQQPVMEQQQAQQQQALATQTEQGKREEDMAILGKLADTDEADKQREHEDRQNARQAAVELATAAPPSQ